MVVRHRFLAVLMLSAAVAASAEVTVIDFHQREVTLEQPAHRTHDVADRLGADDQAFCIIRRRSL